MEWQMIAGMPAYNLPDLVALGIVLFCAVGGWLRGLSGELSRVVTVLLALVLALRLREPLGGLIGGATRLDTPADIALAFTLVAIVALVMLSIVRRLLKRIMQVTFTTGFENIGGMVAGLLRGVALVVTLFVLFNLWPHDYLNRTFGRESLVGRNVQRLLPRIREELENLEYSREPAAATGSEGHSEPRPRIQETHVR